MSLSRASAAGLLFAMVMCAWVYIDRGGLTFDALMLRFAIYFVTFTLGFWALYNFVTARENRSKDDPGD